jgi:hypothetical protein
MAINFHQYLRNGDKQLNMPPITISKRQSDKRIVYDKKRNRLDRIAGDYYQDEASWRLILWANPDYSIEFDIPDRTVIRIPFPLQDVEQEIVQQINRKKNK